MDLQITAVMTRRRFVCFFLIAVLLRPALARQRTQIVSFNFTNTMI
jgi:hypothetical protein